MGCLFAIFAGVFPRLAVLILWIARPERVDAFWVVLAAILDIGHWGASATQRSQIPGRGAAEA
jgi:hypothetical protein